MIHAFKLLVLAVVWWALAFFGCGLEEFLFLLESLKNIKPHSL